MMPSHGQSLLSTAPSHMIAPPHVGRAINKGTATSRREPEGIRDGVGRVNEALGHTCGRDYRSQRAASSHQARHKRAMGERSASASGRGNVHHAVRRVHVRRVRKGSHLGEQMRWALLQIRGGAAHRT